MRKRRILRLRHHVFPSIESLVAKAKYRAGVITVRHNGLPIDIKYEPRGFDCTTVFFHAAITKPDMRFPIFQGAGISQDLPTNRIFISDPTLYLCE